MTADLAALQEAAEALSRACQDADAGLTFEAAFALERSDLAAIGAFGTDSPQIRAWRAVLAAVDAENVIDGVRVA